MSRTMPVLSVVGYSNSGKTRVASELVATLSRWGYRVASIKHCHEGHDLDRPNSDTSKLVAAGAVTVIASSPGRTTTIEETGSDPSLEELVTRIRSEVDIVVAEGFKTSSVAKVLVVGEQAVYPVVDNMVAVVSDREIGVDSPIFGFDELELLAAQVQQQYLNLDNAKPANKPEVASQPFNETALGRRA